MRLFVSAAAAAVAGRLASLLLSLLLQLRVRREDDVVVRELRREVTLRKLPRAFGFFTLADVHPDGQRVPLDAL